jgi:proliferating cell nuclear antigen
MRISMPVAELALIVRDLSQLGESVRIEVSKEGAHFTSEGEAANGKVLLKYASGKISKVKTKEEGDDEEDEENSQKAYVCS